MYKLKVFYFNEIVGSVYLLSILPPFRDKYLISLIIKSLGVGSPLQLTEITLLIDILSMLNFVN